MSEGRGVDSSLLASDMFYIFECITKEEIRYNGLVLSPVPLIVSPNVFRGYTCPEGCGACCRKYQLEYLPWEAKTEEAEEFELLVNEKKIPLMIDRQATNTKYWCRYLDTTTGRCTVYHQRSFGCAFSLLAFTRYKEPRHNVLTCRKLGRHHLYTRIDGQRGTMCELLPVNQEAIVQARQTLSRLQVWADHFQLKTWVPEILEWAAREPVPTEPLRLGYK